MSLELLIYVIEIAGNLGALLFVSTIVLLGASAACAFVWAIESDIDDDKAAAARGRLPKFAIAAVVCAVLASLFPSQKAMYAIAAVSITKDAARTDIGKRIMDAAEKWAVETLEGKRK